MIESTVTWIRKHFGVLLLACISYIPTLVVSVGTYNADTKLYLTTGVRRLLGQARYAWDPSQFAGYVPHQAVGYLWPMGPFYWIFDLLHLPPWLAQRSWVATLFFLASLGVFRLCKLVGFARSSAFVAALAYQLSPYVLAYQSRTSAMLLPWAGLPWIIFFLHKGLHERSWRYPALIAIVVASVGGINATSLIMVIPGPLLYLLDYVVRHRENAKEAVRCALRIGILCSLVSLWWIAMVYLQGKYGGDVLTYSETVEAVSSTSTSTEVFRGLGYWLNYVVTPTFDGTTEALSYLRFSPLFIVSFVVPLLGVAGILFVPSRYRRVSAWWLITGVVLAVGVHPLSDSSPLMSLLANRPTSTIALALRSSTRAIPIVILALSIGLAALCEAVCKLLADNWRRPSAGTPQFVATGSICILLIVSLPSRFMQGVSDPSLDHASVPTYWSQAGDEVTKLTSSQSRAMQLPGQEFGAYSWGYTVDPVLAAVTSSPIVTRDLLPLGDAQVMDLVNAIDDAARHGDLTSEAIYELARVLGVGAVVVPHDLNYSRFGTYSASKISTLFSDDDTEIFGTTDTSISVAQVRGTSIARLESGEVIIEGSGDGLVNASRFGLLSGVIRYAADMTDSEIREAIAKGARVVATDTNRVRAQQWRGSIDTIGYSEDGTSTGPRDSADRRLQLFSDDYPSSRTAVSQTSQAIATATSYGFPLGYWPERRPALAVDGRVETAWTTHAFSDPTGQIITLSFISPHSKLMLRQPTSSRSISEVGLRLDDESAWTTVQLSQDLAQTGQSISLQHPAKRVDVRIQGVVRSRSLVESFPDGVGFSEMIETRGESEEVTIVPSRVVGISSPDAQISFVFARLRAPEDSWWRRDPEDSWSRTFEAPSAGKYTLVGSGRYSVSSEENVARVLGISTFSSTSNSAAFAHAGWRATDGNNETSWKLRRGASLRATLQFGVSGATSSLVIRQCTSSACNAVTKVKISDSDGNSVTSEVSSNGLIDTSSLVAGLWTLEILDTTKFRERDPRFGVNILLPLEVYEIAGAGIVRSTIDSPREVKSMYVNGEQVRAERTFTNIKQDGTFNFRTTVQLEAGTNTVRFADRTELIDFVALTPEKSTISPSTYENLVMTGSPTNRSIVIPPRDETSWLIFGEGFSDGWTASVDGETLKDHRRVDGGFNGWILPPSQVEQEVSLTFTPQRIATVAQIVSLLSVLLCVALIIRTRGRKLVIAADQTFISSQSTLRGRLVGALAILAGAYVLVGLSAIPYAMLAAVIVVGTRKIRLSLLVAATMVSYAVLRVIGRVMTKSPDPLFDWPSASETFHRPMLVGLIVVAVAVTLTDRQSAQN